MTDEEKEVKAFTKWQKRTAGAMKDLALRVFALRERHYMGCGFHYALEQELGYSISGLNNYDGDFYYGKDAWCRRMLLKSRVENLFKRVRKAEVSADELQR